MKKAIIFDMDGVLVDSEYEYLKRLEGFFNERKMTITLAQLSPIAGADDRTMWYILEKMFHQNFDHDVIKQQFSEYLLKHPVVYANIIIDGVEDLLHKLKRDGYALALASSSRMKQIDEMLDTCHLRSYFDVILSGEMFAVAKPNPDIYLKAMELLQIPFKDAIVIEDSSFGIQAAIAAGLYTMARKETRFHVNQAQANVQFQKYSEAYKHIQMKNS